MKVHELDSVDLDVLVKKDGLLAAVLSCLVLTFECGKFKCISYFVVY